MDAIKDILERGAFYTVTDKTLDGPERRRKFQNLEWAHLVLSWVFVTSFRSMVLQLAYTPQRIGDYVSGHIALPDNREKWYQSHIWTAFFDRLLENIPDIRFLRYVNV